LEFHAGYWEKNDHPMRTLPWFQQPRWIVPVQSPGEATEAVVVRTFQQWDMTRCQAWQTKYYLAGSDKNQKRKKRSYEIHQDEERRGNHGTEPKRLLAEEVVRFFWNMLGKEKVFQQSHHENAKTQLGQVRDYLNQGSGVLDVAGGAGHVSMALGSLGIQSTVIDSRSTVGKLPKRDRKIWKRRLKNCIRNGDPDVISPATNDNFLNEFDDCPAVSFHTHRAWFGTKSKSFRHPDEDNLPVISVECGESTSSLIAAASALIALHPDEATGDIVDAAVRYRIPFVVVPCCVFSRVFPDRRTSNGKPVNTYEDLLDYCQEMDPSIQRSQLPFDGKNIALWSTFS
jgi:hypothetical protein